VSLLAQLLVVRLVFFFSSRRRHTRFSRDWSSDVCSSDLTSQSKERAEREAPPCLSFDPAATIRLYGHDIVRNGERHVKRARIVAATTRLTHVGRRPELDAVPAQADNAEFTDRLVSDLRAKLTQSLVSRRN